MSIAHMNGGAHRMDPPPLPVLAIARSYVAAGLSVLPIRADGTKAPEWGLLPREFDPAEGRERPVWKPYQSRLPTEAELHAWFASGRYGIAVVCGAVSGNLEVLDFESVELFERWQDNLLRCRSPLLGRLPVVATPRPGRHVYYRLPFPPQSSRKIARRRPTPEELTGRPGLKAVVLIETKGEAGYVLAPGSPPGCHASGGLYRHLGGPSLLDVPLIAGSLAS